MHHANGCEHNPYLSVIFCFAENYGIESFPVVNGSFQYRTVSVEYLKQRLGIRKVNIISKKENFVKGLIDNVGWNAQVAEEHFMNLAPMHEVGNEVDFIIEEKTKLSNKYPNIKIAPLFYKVEDNMLYCIE